MTELRIKVPEDLEFMKQISDIDWSILFNKFIRSELSKIERLKKGLSKSELTETDVEELTDKINESLSKRYL